jgi:hypothetical protein
MNKWRMMTTILRMQALRGRINLIYKQGERKVAEMTIQMNWRTPRKKKKTTQSATVTH